MMSYYQFNSCLTTTVFVQFLRPLCRHRPFASMAVATITSVKIVVTILYFCGCSNIKNHNILSLHQSMGIFIMNSCLYSYYLENFGLFKKFYTYWLVSKLTGIQVPLPTNKLCSTLILDLECLHYTRFQYSSLLAMMQKMNR